MRFNPALTAQELMPVSVGHPAMMKGYIDRVFARGFAYGSSEGIVHGLLGGKKAVLVTCSGAPLPVLVKSGSSNVV